MSRVHAPALTVASIAAIAAIAAIAFLAACSSSGGGTGSTPPPTPVKTVTTTPSIAVSTRPTSAAATTSAPASAPATTTATSASPVACAEAQLRASAAVEKVPGIHRHVVRLMFANTSTRACTLTGYPGAAIVNAAGQQVQEAKRVVGGPVAGTVERVSTLTVRPGASVFAYLEGESTKEQGAAQAGCDGPKFPRILVTPPNTRTAVPFTIGWPQCYAFDVHPVREQ